MSGNLRKSSSNVMHHRMYYGGTPASYTKNILKYHSYIYHFQPNRFVLPFPTMHLYEVHTSQHCSRTPNHHSHRSHNCEENAHPEWQAAWAKTHTLMGCEKPTSCHLVLLQTDYLFFCSSEQLLSIRLRGDQISQQTWTILRDINNIFVNF